MKKSKLFILSGLAMLTMAFAMSCSNPAGGDTTPAPTPKPTPQKVEKMNFGVWPQSAKLEEVTITESNTYKVNAWECYKGSDDADYVKEGDSYFKLEPIEWIVINDNYNGGKLLLANKILDKSCFNKIGYKRISGKVQVDSENKREIEGTEIYPNNYQYSQVRAYLNGLNGTSYKNDDFDGNGFLQKAFDEESINSLKEIEVQKDVKDKVFVLSDIDDVKDLSAEKLTRELTDYAKAKHTGKQYWLRTTVLSFSGWLNAAFVNPNGSIGHGMMDVSFGHYGVVPAIVIANE